MTDETARIERAWKINQDWVTAFDGSAHEAYLPDVAVSRLRDAFNALMQNSTRFDVGAIWAEDVSDEQLAEMGDSWDYVQLLADGRVLELSINTIAGLPGFDLDVHLIVRARDADTTDIEVIWWADQAFPDDTDWRARFDAILAYFILLQQRFNAEKLYIGPESLDRPGASRSTWVAV